MQTPDAMARHLGVTTEAVQAVRHADLVDLHIDTFIPMRLWGYDPMVRHGLGPTGGRFGGHLDFPRMEDAGVSGAMWSVTTNPARTRSGRWKTVRKNFRNLRSTIDRTAGKARIVSNYADYRAAVDAGVHAVLLSIQGGNAMDAAPEHDPLPDPDLLRVTLVHLTNSNVGESSNPKQIFKTRGLSDLGRTLVRRLNDRRVFIDLAHISRQAFWDAYDVHDKSQPVLVTHTGVDGVTPHWRNLDDDQIRAVAETGGVVGIMFHIPFLRREGPQDCTMVIDHVQHVIDTVGEDYVALGSDYDGAIVPPADLRSGDSYPRLVQAMLDRGWSTDRIEKILGGNFLRAFRELRPQG